MELQHDVLEREAAGLVGMGAVGDARDVFAREFEERERGEADDDADERRDEHLDQRESTLAAEQALRCARPDQHAVSPDSGASPK